MRFINKKGSRGFTLLELLLVLGVVGIISTFAISIAGSVRNMSNVSETKNRMIEIAGKAKQYYRGHETLPAADGTPADDVPVGSADLDLEQKYRLDSWGQFLHYNRVRNASNINIDSLSAGGQLIQIAANTKTDITGLTVDGKSVAGVLVSGGPNQSIETTTWAGGTSTIYTTSGDDIVVPINVSPIATQIALDDLNELQAKVKAFDAIYEGFNNDNNGTVDEDGCVAQEDVGGGTYSGFCPPDTPISPTNNNDPNCGVATLDEIKTGSYNLSTAGDCSDICNATTRNWGDVTTVSDNDYNTADEARAFIFSFYCLTESQMVDPWLNGYVWGESGAPTYASTDRRYHRFFSLGPDGCTEGLTIGGTLCGTETDDDDIIP